MRSQYPHCKDHKFRVEQIPSACPQRNNLVTVLYERGDCTISTGKEGNASLCTFPGQVPDTLLRVCPATDRVEIPFRISQIPLHSRVALTKLLSFQGFNL